MASEVDICNQALDFVGAATIVTLTEQSQNAALCKRLLPLARDSLLQSHHWRWARTKVALAPLENETSKEWAYVYQRPADCLTPLYIEPESYSGDGTYVRNGLLYSTVTIPFGGPQFEARGDHVLTNEPDAVLVYTQRVTEAGKFPPMFADALSYLMATRLGAALRVDPDLVRTAQQIYTGARQSAMAADQNEATNRDDRDAEWHRARA